MIAYLKCVFVTGHRLVEDAPVLSGWDRWHCARCGERFISFRSLILRVTP